MMRHWYGISTLDSEASFHGETIGGVAKCQLFSQATLLRIEIEHDNGAVDREVLVRYILWPNLTTEYSLPSQWITVFALVHLLPLRSE